MKKRIIAKTMQKSLILPQVQQRGWSLCIGAGISMPIFPSWNELVAKLIQKISPEITKDEINELLNKFSPDTLIQAAWSMSNHDDFSELLSDILYGNLQKKTTSKEWDSIRNNFTSAHLLQISKESRRNFLNIRDKLFDKTTSYQLAKLIAYCKDSIYAPKSILSFNAEPLLYSLINSFIYQDNIDKRGNNERDILQIMTKSTSCFSTKKIPYYFCHGALLNSISTKYKKEYDAESRIVFSESQYLNMSNNYSWQSISFLDTCMKSTVIFVGLSLTDPNMRKWLNSVQKERNIDIGDSVESTQHFWIEKEPNNKVIMDWMEASVCHLGIRIVWIKKWSEVVSVISNMIGSNYQKNSQKGVYQIIK